MLGTRTERKQNELPLSIDYSFKIGGKSFWSILIKMTIFEIFCERNNIFLNCLYQKILMEKLNFKTFKDY